MFSPKDVRVFLKAYNDRGDSLKQGITHILMKEKDVCNELRSIFATWKIISIEINGSNKRISKNDCLRPSRKKRQKYCNSRFKPDFWCHLSIYGYL